MKNYIKPSANVIEMAVKERLSQTSENRRYKVRIGNNTTREKDITTNIYTSSSVSKIELRDGATATE